MTQLPIFFTPNRDLHLMQSKWASILNPVLQLPMLDNVTLQNVELVTGNNIINHKLGRKQQGWIVADVNAAISIYRNAPFNDLTLTLNSSGSGTVTLIVF